MIKRLKIKIYGKVQMVGFRYSAVELAEKLNLTGWVRNVQDDGVEIVAQGEEKNLQELLNWAYSGPSGAQVEKVEFEWQEFKNEFDKFKAIG